MENVVFAGAEAAIARIHIDQSPPPEVVEAIAGHEHVLATDLIRIS
jgi:hypothetical protein